MKVLIINPPPINNVKFAMEGRCQQRDSSFQYSMVPISLPYVAASLIKEGADVKIIDCMVNNYSIAKTLEIAKGDNPNLIIINISMPTFYVNKQQIDEIKKITNCHISAMGIYVTSLPEDALKYTLIDSVIRAEPEITARELAKHIRDNADLRNVEGISYKQEAGAIIHNREREFIQDLDSLPFPARHLLDNKKYKAPISYNSSTLIVTSRGCPHDCIFCNAHLYYGKKVRIRSVANIIEEIKEVLFTYKINEIVFWADTFTLNRELVIDLCTAILDNKLKFKWSCNSRVDTVDKEMLDLMSRAGCYIISYGIESGSQEILNNIKKHTSIAQIKTAVHLSHNANIDVAAHMIVGLPGETKETLRETANLIKSIKPTFLQVYGAIPYPGTEFYKQASQNNWLKTKKLENFELSQIIVRTASLSEKDLKKARRQLLVSFYTNPFNIVRILKRAEKLRELILLIKSAFSFWRHWIYSDKTEN